MDWIAAGAAFAICLAFAAAEGALSGKALPVWLAGLRKPRLYAPMGVWIAVAALTYALQGFIAYRLLAAPASALGVASLAALALVMAGNVAYNAILARRRQARLLFVGIVLFLPPLIALQILLFAADRAAAAANAIYALWVIVYDLPIMYAVWRLNENPANAA
jgi:tryptophan-rich sensory protein